MSGNHFGKQEGRHGTAAAGRVVFEGAGTFDVTKAEKDFCNRKSIQLLAGLDAFSIAEEVAEPYEYFFRRRNAVFFYWGKKAKVAEEKGDGATAFDRMRGRNVISL